MRKVISVLFISTVLLVGVIRGQDIQGNIAPNRGYRDPNYRDPLASLRTIKAAKMPLTKYVLFVIDVSGSMNTSKELDHAVALTRRLMSQSVDEYYIGIITFNGTSTRWCGCPDEKQHVPWGWAAMPNADNYAEASKWLGQSKADGTTDPSGALESAFNDPHSELSVILITDGIFCNNMDNTAIVQSLQEKRQKKGLLPVTLMLFGMGASSAKSSDLLRMSYEARGGFYVMD